MKSSEPFQNNHLFAVLLGGRAVGCKVELHDVAFAVGPSLEDTYPQLLDQWFGEAHGLHMDAYARVDQVAGYQVTLRPDAPRRTEPRLYFVNIGGYRAGEFGERHAYTLLAAANKSEAKKTARQTLLPNHDSVHKDDLYDVDDVLEVRGAGDLHVHLTPDAAAENPPVTNGYFPLPRSVIAAWLEKR